MVGVGFVVEGRDFPESTPAVEGDRLTQGAVRLESDDAGAAILSHPLELQEDPASEADAANGWRHLVDSSLDWGQDLPGLAQWLEQNNPGPSRSPVYLAYFGTGDPAHEGIAAHALPRLPRLGPSL